MCLVISDLAQALFVMPFRIFKVAEFIDCCYRFNSYVCLIEDTVIKWLNYINVDILVYLCLDKFIMLYYPIVHLNKVNVKPKFIILGILSAQAMFLWTPVFLEISHYKCFVSYPMWLHYASFAQFTMLLFIALVICICLCVFSCKQRDWNATKIVNFLGFNFIVLLLPSAVFWELEHVGTNSNDYIIGLVRLLQPATNGWIIVLTRPVYRKTLNIFLTAKPSDWRRRVTKSNVPKKSVFVAARHSLSVKKNKKDMIDFYNKRDFQLGRDSKSASDEETSIAFRVTSCEVVSATGLHPLEQERAKSRTDIE